MKRILFAALLIFAALSAARAQTPISALPSATPSTTDAIPFVAMGTTPKVTKRTTPADLFSLLQPSHVASANKQGNGSKFQLFGGGSVATNDCGKFDASGNTVSAGAPCGTVTSVGLSVPGVLFSVSGSPVTSSGTFTFSLLTQNANKVFAGPSSGADATPTFRFLVAGDEPSTTVNSCVNDTNVTCSISSQALTLSWAGALAKARQHAATVYNDQANVFGNFLQTHPAGAYFNFVDPADATKKAHLVLTNISAGNDRALNIPDADSTTAQAKSSASHQFLTAMSAQGVFTSARPACGDLSDAAASCSTDTTNAANITSGTLDRARLPASVVADVYRSTNQSISTGAITAITFDSETEDSFNFHSTVSNTDRLTVPTGYGGHCELAGFVEFDPNATGMRQAAVRKNGSTWIGGFSINATAGGNYTRITVATPNVSCADGDYFQLIVFQDSGGSLNVNAQPNYGAGLVINSLHFTITRTP